MKWDTLRYSGEYHSDFEDALMICRSYLGLDPSERGENPEIDALMNKAACVAIASVKANRQQIKALATAAEGKDGVSRDEIVAIIEQTDASAGLNVQ